MGEVLRVTPDLAIPVEELEFRVSRSSGPGGQGVNTTDSRVELRFDLAGYGVAEVGMLVAAEWRRRGVGSALLGAGIAWAREAGAHKVALQVWPHNQAAITLYEKFGFQREGLLRRHYRRRNGELWDAVVMGLPLDPGAPTG